MVNKKKPTPAPKKESRGKKLLKGIIDKTENIVRGALGLPKVMTVNQAVAWMETMTKGRIFGINFLKTRSTNTLRVMTCKYGVPGQRGGVLPYDAKQHHLTIVYDLRIREHRAVPWEGIQGLLISGEYHKVRN